MNLLLLEPSEIDPARRARLAGRRGRHLLRVLGVEPGRRLRAGLLEEGSGTVVVEEVTDDTVTVRLEAVDTPPPPPDTDLLLALPRPKALRRILRRVASMGVGRLHLVNAWRVEKSYFSSLVLDPERIGRELLLGAEQGMIPRLPEVSVHRFFVPFLEELEAEPPAGPRLAAHPGAPPIEEVVAESLAPPAGRVPRTLLAVGPEGGWIEDELSSLARAGFTRVSLGPWTLTTEGAVTAALAQLALLRRLGRTPAE